MLATKLPLEKVPYSTTLNYERSVPNFTHYLPNVDVAQSLERLRKTDGKIGHPAQRHWQNGTENINLQYKNNLH